MSSNAQVNANRANAKLSTGPRSPEGKQKSSLNAVKTGLTGRTVLLPADDAAAYQEHCQRVAGRLRPRTQEEQSLVQSIADTEWRLLRIPSLESSIYALGRVEFAGLFAEQEDPQVRASLIDAKIFLTYQKQLNNLGIQEARLRRQRENDQAEFQKLKSARQTQIQVAASRLLDAQEKEEPFDLAEFGFEISMPEVERQAARLTAAINRYSHPYLHQDDRKDAA